MTVQMLCSELDKSRMAAAAATGPSQAQLDQLNLLQQQYEQVYTSSSSMWGITHCNKCQCVCYYFMRDLCLWN